MANTYLQMLQAVENYYGAGSDQWLTMANWTGYQSAEVANILKQVPGITTYTNEAGELLSYSLEASPSYYTAAEAAAAEAAGAINSNAIAAETAVQNLAIPANVVEGATAGTVEISSGATAVATGTKVSTVLGHIGTGVLGAAVGMKCGVWLDAGLYESGLADIWDPENAWAYNPENWKDYKVVNWLYDYSGYDDFQALFNADDEQLYVNEELFALMAQYMASQGCFNDPQSSAEKENIPSENFLDKSKLPDSIPYITAPVSGTIPGTSDTWGWSVDSSDAPIKYTVITPSDDLTYYQQLLVSTQPFTVTYWTSTGYTQQYPAGQITMADGGIFYQVGMTDRNDRNFPIQKYVYTPISPYDKYNTPDDYAKILAYGRTEVTPAVPGVNPYDTMPTGITPQMTTPEVINLLKQQYPELWDDAIKQGSLNDDGTITDRVYVPVAVPTGGTSKQPTTDPEHPGAVDPDNKPQTQYVTNIVNPTPNPTEDPNPPEKGSGKTPTAPMPTGSASALYKIYNPTEAQIQSFGAWLWSSNFVDQLLKIFNDPMQAIISLHKIYATPHTGGTANIKVGYLDSGVASKWVDQQYIDVDCGSVKLLEKNGNVFDYAPFVDVRIYLPFVGIVSLAVADVMRSTINVKYRIDVITGTCIATVSVTRDGGAGGVIYQYTGSMAENYPLSSGSYMGIITGMLGLAAGVAGTIATGGAAAPALLGGAAGLTAMHTKVEHSNGFSGNAGALACKKPYLIISRQQAAIANGVDANIGYPTNSLVSLSQCRGFTKVKAIHLHGIRNATDAEQDEIIRLLTEGVII